LTFIESVDRERLVIVGRIMLVLSAILGAASPLLPALNVAGPNIRWISDPGARALTLPWLVLLVLAACGVWVQRWRVAVIGSVVVLAVFLGWSSAASLVRARDGLWTLWGAGTWTLLGCGVLVTAAAVLLVIGDRPTWEPGLGLFSASVLGLSALAVVGRWLSTFPQLTIDQAQRGVPFSPGLIGSSVLTLAAAWWVSRLRPARMSGWPVITLGVVLGCSSLVWYAVATGSLTRSDGTLGLPVGLVANEVPAVGSWLQALAGLALLGLGLGRLATPTPDQDAESFTADSSPAGF
jgi:hypothetical protein